MGRERSGAKAPMTCLGSAVSSKGALGAQHWSEENTVMVGVSLGLQPCLLFKSP